MLAGAEPDQDPWGSTLSYSVSGQALWCCDVDTGRLRPATRQDLAEFSWVVDAIPNLGRAHPTFVPQDVPVGSAEIHAFATIMLNSRRPHRVSCYSERMLPYFIELQTIAEGSLEAVKRNPIFAAKVWFNTPFMITGENIRIGMKARELLGQPLMISTMPVAGMATPVTLAGCLVQTAAEVLMCNAMTLAVDDRVCGWTGGPLSLDMRTGIHTQTAPEVSLLLLGASELACHIFGGRPAATGGPTCAAKTPGAQSMMEKAVNADFAIAGGCRSFGSLALLAFADIGSLVQLMLDLELMSYYERLLQGIEVTEDKLAEELICEVGPTGARYLDTDHTAEHYREEVWLPELLDRRPPMAWADDPVTMLDNAQSKATRLLAAAENQCPLTADQRRDVQRIVAAADREVASDRRAHG
jgi:trimethylamine--corrinoid protein Co-methyltransferase